MTQVKDSPQWREELKATMRTRQELGEEMEDEVIESFLERLEASINDQVDARVAALAPKRRRSGLSTGRIAVVLCLSIPLFGIAGGIGDLYGILAVVALDLVLILKP